MVRIIADTSTLYNSRQAEEAGFNVNPLSVTIAGKSYKEFDEISSEAFVSIIHQGHMPTSSQPAIGDVAASFDRFPEDEIIAAVRRGFSHGFKYVADALVKHGAGAGWKVYITHADAINTAELALSIVQKAIPDAEFEILPLSPAFITQGGPGCVAVQCIKI